MTAVIATQAVIAAGRIGATGRAAGAAAAERLQTENN